ncbi:hypothetical protein F3G58_31840, partial [Pseudomonas aeruginosa]
VVLRGIGEPGVRVFLPVGNGNPFGHYLAVGRGNWSFTPGTPLANATGHVPTPPDPTGKPGPPAASTVDAVAPPAPVI